MRVCQRPACGNPIEGRPSSARYCSDDCRDDVRRAKQRSAPIPPRDCDRCGTTIEKPYKGDQRYCSSDCSYAVHLEAVGKPPAREDEQMAKLFRYYQSKENITITERPEGTRLVSLSDTQLPFVDQPLLEAVYTFVEDFKPHDIIINGDWLDCYSISAFDQRPERLFNLEDEMQQGADIIRQLKRLAAKDCRVYFVFGNHEERLEKEIWRRAQNFSFLVKTIPEAMELDTLCEGYVPYGKHVDYLGFVFTHGNFVSAFSAYTARKHYERYRSSGVNGHTHRLGSYSSTDMHGRSHTWYEQGALCRKDLEYVRGVANWQQGFLTATVAAGALHPQLVHVIETDQGRGFFAAGRYYAINDVR